MEKNLLKRFEHYLWLTLLIVGLYVFFMTFIFPKSWADTSQAASLIEAVSSVVPMVLYLQESPVYSNYWGVFYSVFWIISSSFPVLGFISTLFLSEKSLNILREMPGPKLILMLLFLVAIDLFVFTVPEVGGNPWFNEVSNNFVILLFTGFEISGCLHMLGVAVGAIRIKSSRNFV